MAIRHRVPVLDHQRGAGVAAPPTEGGKQQQPADGNNRRALGDIGNLVHANARPAAEAGKQPQQPQVSRPVTRSFGAQFLTNAQVSRPVTRSFGAQLLANAQIAAEPAAVAKKNAVKVDAGGGGVAAAAGKVVAVLPKPKPARAGADAAKPKPKPRPKPEEVVEISPDSGKPSSAKKKTASSSSSSSKRKEKVHTFSAVLTARSKAACGLTSSSKPPVDDVVPDIDASDVGDQLAVVEYVEDIYKFYKLSENAFRPKDYMGSQVEINARMRAILADWLIEVHHKFELMPETLYLAVYVIDRYLSLESVPRRELQLVGMSAMLIACKYEEIWAPEVNDFICISDMAYNREQILVMEKGILDKLEWNLTVPTPYVFLVRFLKAALADKEMEEMVFFLAELGLTQYSVMIPYSASMAAAASVYAARCTLNKSPLWTKTLERHTGFSESQLRECAKLLVELHSAAPESKLKAAYKKYSSPQRGAVALHPPATTTKVLG